MYSSDLKNKCYHKKGYILETDKISKYKHIFGGESWSYLDKNPLNDKPILLFVLDLKDSKLSFLRVDGLEEIPIFSYLNSDLWYEPQIYKINPEDKSVFFTDKKNHIEYMQSDEDKIMNPIPPKCVSLREMKLSEYVTDEDSYWKNSDEFLGGDSFIRILGEPLWIQNKLEIKCSCSQCMYFVMGIGYEPYNAKPKLIPNEVFFFGESALYIFFCKDCLEIKIIPQFS